MRGLKFPQPLPLRGPYNSLTTTLPRKRSLQYDADWISRASFSAAVQPLGCSIQSWSVGGIELAKHTGIMPSNMASIRFQTCIFCWKSLLIPSSKILVRRASHWQTFYSSRLKPFIAGKQNGKSVVCFINILYEKYAVVVKQNS